MEAIKYIQADESDLSFSVGETYFNQLDKNKSAFDNKINEEKEIVISKGSSTGNDNKIIKYLRSFLMCKRFTDIEENIINKMIQAWENGDIPSKITKDILKAIKLTTDVLEAYATVYDLIPERYLQQTNSNKSTSQTEKKVILSCYMTKQEE